MCCLLRVITHIDDKQSNGANKLHLKANMRTEDGLDGMKIDESGNVHPIHLRDNQSEDPSFEAQKPWKKNYVISSSDKTTEEHQAPKQISTGGRIALIFALAGIVILHPGNCAVFKKANLIGIILQLLLH